MVLHRPGQVIVVVLTDVFKGLNAKLRLMMRVKATPTKRGVQGMTKTLSDGKAPALGLREL